MEPIEIFVATSCTLLAVLGGWKLSERSRKNERRDRCVDTLIGVIDTDIAHFSTLDDTASESVMSFHFDSCMRMRPHLETIRLVMPKEHEGLKEIYDEYDFPEKTKNNYETRVFQTNEFPRRHLTSILARLKSELHKL